MKYGIIFKELRENKNLTQTELATQIGINRVQYTQYENDYNTMPIRHLNNLCNFFDVSLDFVFGFNQEKRYPNSKIAIDKNLTGKRLKKLRKDNKITQEKLSSKLNVSRTTITEIERGINYIATSFLYSICKTYNISADYLLGKIDFEP